MHKRNIDLYSFVFRTMRSHSNDVQWVHVLRILYRSVAIQSILTVEALLEQIFTQSVEVAQQLLCALEDAAMALGKAVICKSYDRRSMLALPTESVVQIDGTPILSHYDIRLALILSRSIFIAGLNNSTEGAMFTTFFYITYLWIIFSI